MAVDTKLDQELNQMSLQQIVAQAQKLFEKRFGHTATVAAYSPGRVNLIGEHTDYNGGWVLPMTIPRYTVVVGSELEDDQQKKCLIRTECTIFDQEREVELNWQKEIKPDSPSWANYVRGVLALFPEKHRLPSFQALIISNLPIGQGLSSSAALEVSFLCFLEGLINRKGFKLNMSILDKALLCQQCEHRFAGVPCGLMDQLITLAGNAEHALLIDCRSFDLIPAPLNRLAQEGFVLLVCNSHVRHELAGSEYADRKRSCERVAATLGLSSLRDATLELLQSNQDKLDSQDFNNCRHVVSENLRTQQASQALAKGDLVKLGQLMLDSHRSLRDDYKVSCDALDQLVELAMEACPKAVLGARMTGGGFGGCTVSLVRKDQVKNVTSYIAKKYTGHQLAPDFYVFLCSEGANHLLLSH